jgi:hypothetical protein
MQRNNPEQNDAGNWLKKGDFSTVINSGGDLRKSVIYCK